MKLLQNHFEDYLKNKKLIDIHPKFDYSIFPEKIDEFKNVILYGPPGIGKYTQMLSIIQKYSPSKLKYEKKMTVTFNKTVYYFKISDIHFEIDLSLLGCNSKLLWNETFNNIIDVILTRVDKFGIIVCKNFHEIHAELLEVFYSYMQTNFNSAVSLKFILITENISFIPNNIINCSKIISLERPSQTMYNKAFKIKHKQVTNSSITNINELTSVFNLNSDNLFNQITMLIKDPQNGQTFPSFNFQTLREKIYDLFIYNVNIHDFVWDLFKYIVDNDLLQEKDVSSVLLKTNEFLKYYNNNYRSIFHLENYLLYIISVVHELPKSM